MLAVKHFSGGDVPLASYEKKSPTLYRHSISLDFIHLWISPHAIAKFLYLHKSSLFLTPYPSSEMLTQRIE